MKAILFLLLLTPTLSLAQAYKCQEAGKWTYQAVPCSNVPSQAVNVSPSSAGVTGLKAEADRMAIREEQQRADAAFNPKSCSFQYFVYGDELGKTLAKAAKDECLSTRGKQGPAYTRWRDHFQTNASRRDAAAARSQQQMQSAQQPRTFNCRPDGFGGMRCN